MVWLLISNKFRFTVSEDIKHSKMDQLQIQKDSVFLKRSGKYTAKAPTFDKPSPACALIGKFILFRVSENRNTWCLRSSKSNKNHFEWRLNKFKILPVIFKKLFKMTVWRCKHLSNLGFSHPKLNSYRLQNSQLCFISPCHFSFCRAQCNMCCTATIKSKD